MSADMKGRRSRWAEAILLAFGMLLGTALLEGGARLAVRGQPSKGGYSPVRGHRSHEPMNTAGYRDVEHTKEKPPGVRRIVFAGDSFTYGVGVLLDDAYPKRVERGLQAARAEKWESIVLAVPGINTEQEAVILENEGFSYSPDVVVLGYVLNDAEEPGAAELRRAAEWTEAEEVKQNPPFWRRSALLGLVADRLRATAENRDRVRNHLALYAEGAPGFAAVKKSITRVAALCRDKGVPFIVVIFPLFANSLDEHYPFASVHEKVGAVARSAGATLVDLLPYYSGMDWRLLVVEGARDEHPNELAHRIAAQALLAALDSTSLPPHTGEPGPASQVH
jgi:hypothetical protein